MFAGNYEKTCYVLARLCCATFHVCMSAVERGSHGLPVREQESFHVGRGTRVQHAHGCATIAARDETKGVYWPHYEGRYCVVEDRLTSDCKRLESCMRPHSGIANPALSCVTLRGQHLPMAFLIVQWCVMSGIVCAS